MITDFAAILACCPAPSLADRYRFGLPRLRFARAEPCDDVATGERLLYLEFAGGDVATGGRLALAVAVPIGDAAALLEQVARARLAPPA